MYQIKHASNTLFTLGTIFVDNENQRTITVSLDQNSKVMIAIQNSSTLKHVNGVPWDTDDAI